MFVLFLNTAAAHTTVKKYPINMYPDKSWISLVAGCPEAQSANPKINVLSVHDAIIDELGIFIIWVIE